MKISKILFSIIISTLFIVLSCDDEETVELYEPQLIDADSTSLVYEKLTTYPSLGSFESANPTTSDIETPYGFRILKTSSPTGAVNIASNIAAEGFVTVSLIKFTSIVKNHNKMNQWVIHQEVGLLLEE